MSQALSLHHSLSHYPLRLHAPALMRLGDTRAANR
jgi:hypothetical protein